MTIKIPRSNVFDKFLKVFGKKRGVIVPSDVYKKHGPFVYVVASKESFWKALFRSKIEELPEGVIDINSLHEKDTSKL